MFSREEYIRLSLSLNLFFLRIMKEHAIFLKGSFTPRDGKLAETAGYYQSQFEDLLREAVHMADGMLGAAELESGQFVTQYTLDAEQKTSFLTSIPIDTAITMKERSLLPGMGGDIAAGMEAQVSDLNRKAIAYTTALVGFKSRLLADLGSCRMYMHTYWLLLDHIIREANQFIAMLMKLQNRAANTAPRVLMDEEAFWNRIMAEHAKFIRGLLDPTEEPLFNTANRFGNQFDELTQAALKAVNNPALAGKVREESLHATLQLRDFKSAGTAGILQCKIKGMILPLLADHVLREANHYIYILKM